MNTLQPERLAFYPMSAKDYLDPLRMLKGKVDQMYFCDVRFVPRSTSDQRAIAEVVSQEKLPTPSYILGDALSALKVLRPVDIFFHRRDSSGEGGSGLFLLGPALLDIVVQSIKPNGIIVTDLSFVGPWCGQLLRGEKTSQKIGDRAIVFSADQPWLCAGLRSFTVQ